MFFVIAALGFLSVGIGVFVVAALVFLSGGIGVFCSRGIGVFVQALVLKVKALIATDQVDQARNVIAAINNIWQKADSDFFEFIEFKEIEAQLNNSVS